MNVQSVYVQRLFGNFDYMIPINHDEGITIIYGPNGCGKTTILKLLMDLLNERVGELKRVPFSKFQLDFDDSSKIEVTKINKNGVANESKGHSLMYNYTSSNGEQQSYVPPVIDPEKMHPMRLREEWPFLRRVGPRLWEDRRTGNVLHSDELVDMFADTVLEPPEWIIRLKEEIPAHLISANRLISVSKILDLERERLYSRKEGLTVNLYSQELSRTIEAKLAESAALSQELDRTFPNRLLKQMVEFKEANAPLEDIIEEKLGELDEKRARLAEVGLLDNSGHPPVQSRGKMEPYIRSVLALYIEDTGKKLSVYNDLEQRINLLMKIINKRFSNKKISVARNKGFVVTLDDGTFLDPGLLSSGEQHELVLIYDLLFHSKPGSLILLDEPEISLHIAWQQELLDDMLEITRLTGTRVLLATHSPDIISGRWDLTVGLGGKES